MSESGNRRRRLRYILGGAAVLVLLAGAGLWWFVFRDDAPAEVDITAANEQLDADLAAAAAADDGDGDLPSSTTTVAGFDGDIDGVWTVDSTLGEFTFDSASGSFAGFRVEEELVGPGEVTAVGRTGGVTGSIEIGDGELRAATVDVDLTTIRSDRPRREGPIQRALETATFPTASFVLTQPITLPAGTADGDLVSVAAVGDLSIHGVTRSATFALEANVRDDGIAVVTGRTELVWEDFGVTPPSASIVVAVADEGIVEFQLLLTK